MSRYLLSNDFPQPIKKIIASSSDIIHTLKMGERIDNLAQKYYNDPLMGWVIMCANPEWENEFEIPFGSKIRIPYPLQRVFDSWKINNEL